MTSRGYSFRPYCLAQTRIASSSAAALPSLLPASAHADCYVAGEKRAAGATVGQPRLQPAHPPPPPRHPEAHRQGALPASRAASTAAVAVAAYPSTRSGGCGPLTTRSQTRPASPREMTAGPTEVSRPGPGGSGAGVGGVDRERG